MENLKDIGPQPTAKEVLIKLRNACYGIGRPVRLIQNANDFVSIVNEIDEMLDKLPK